MKPTDKFVENVYQSCVHLRNKGFDMMHCWEIRTELALSRKKDQKIWDALTVLAQTGKLKHVGAGYYEVKEG